MSDDKTKVGGTDGRRVAASQGYEVEYFASKHRISMAQAREIIGRVGSDRAKLNEAAGKVKRS